MANNLSQIIQKQDGITAKLDLDPQELIPYTQISKERIPLNLRHNDDRVGRVTCLKQKTVWKLLEKR